MPPIFFNASEGIGFSGVVYYSLLRLTIGICFKFIRTLQRAVMKDSAACFGNVSL